ncbi:MAG: hypothetical protein AAF399_28385 [Bacteroidota bacterium]
MVGIVVLLFLVPCPTNSQYQVYRIVLAIALAGFAAVIPGFLQVKHKQALSAGGALAVFVLAYLFDPAAQVPNDGCNQPFTLTIFLEDANGSTVLRDQGSLVLTLPKNKQPESIDEDGKVTFDNLSATLAQDSTQVELLAEGWQFTNGKPTTRISLGEPDLRLVIERDASLCCLRGSVRDEQGPVSGVLINVGSDQVRSDSSGGFVLELSELNQREEVTLSAQTTEHQFYSAKAYPGSQQDVSILLNSK